jgi:apoptosis-inducing factor 2
VSGVTDAPIDVDGTPISDRPDGPHTVRFDYALYALGSRLPAPIDIWDGHWNDVVSHNNGALDSDTARSKCQKKGTKGEAVEWLRRCQERVAAARSVLVVGGGALGIREWSLAWVRR